MRICIFEDSGVALLEPLTLTRPAFALWCGAQPLLDRHRAMFGATEVSLWVRPELVVEVISPSDRWPKVLANVAEYLDAGTTVVLVLDYQRRLAHVYRADGTTLLLGADEELAIPDLFGDFHVRVGRFFE